MEDFMLVIRFDDGPGQTTGRFIEVELDGRSVSLGEWVKDPDTENDWLLVMPPEIEAAFRENMRLNTRGM
jgi:hypothetical protein